MGTNKSKERLRSIEAKLDRLENILVEASSLAIRTRTELLKELDSFEQEEVVALEEGRLKL